MGYRTFVPKQCPTVFSVRNIAANGKRVKLFNTPIKNGYVRDLMAIPNVSEAIIRHHLLKGELNIKIRADEIEVVESNIDLIQFDECQKQFLIAAGVINGLESGSGTLNFMFKQGQELIGVLDGINKIFTTPDKFIQGIFGNNDFRILISHNGRTLAEGEDYIVAESGGAGTGYDTIIFKCTTPDSDSTLFADYVSAI